MHSNQSFNVMCEYMLLDCIFLHIMLERTPNKKNIYIYLNSIMTSSKSKLSENIDNFGDNFEKLNVDSLGQHSY
jgi:hypothetical protein